MRSLDKLVDVSKFTEKGLSELREAYDVISRMDKGLSAMDITIITNVCETNLYAFYSMLRAKEAEMHGVVF